MLRKLTKSPTSENELYELADSRPALLVKLYRGKNAEQRREKESATLRLWECEGFEAPRVADVTVDELAGPYLVFTRLGGRSLQQILRDGAVPLEEKLACLRQAAGRMRQRHERAIEINQIGLVHGDCNTANIMLDGGPPAWLDLESTPRESDVPSACAIEIGKFCRWSMRDLAGRTAEVAEIIVQTYTDSSAGLPARGGLLDLLIARTLSRPFQFFHRWQDRRHKARFPSDITKYDVADALRAALHI